MKLLMPSHVRRVQLYSDPVPLFQRYGVEDQLSGMYQPLVQLKSGGYLVINPTEALVSIDINSGRSTREHNIEQTAYATNIEAAHEIARQLRLRDMAGLVVIDFIDMESNGHVRKVEKAMKDALKNDRARIQVGRISSFGLMEMSRQRLRTGVLEASTKPCPHCEGSGLMRTASSSGLSALRMLEDEAARGRGSRIILRAGREAAIYVLNRKRFEIGEIEARYGVAVEVLIDESFEGAKMSVESVGPRPAERPPLPAIAAPAVEEEELAEEFDEEEEEEEEEAEEPAEERAPREGKGGRERERDDEQGDRGKRRRRRGRRGGRRRGREEGDQEEGRGREDEAGPSRQESEPPAEAPAEAEAESDEGAGEQPRKGRRRPRARRKEESGAEAADRAEPEAEAPSQAAEPEAQVALDVAPAKPKRSRRRKPDVAVETAVAPAETVSEELRQAPAETAGAEDKPAPKRRSRRKAEPVTEPTAGLPAGAPEAPVLERQTEDASAGAAANDAEGDGSPRRGWWQRTFGG
jgi:ribonuclease E